MDEGLLELTKIKDYIETYNVNRDSIMDYIELRIKRRKLMEITEEQFNRSVD